MKNGEWILTGLIVTGLVVWWLCVKEGYSPFRHTGGCPPRTGRTYLDAYEQQDYYRKYPYVYPTPHTYITNWYAARRAENDWRMKAREEVAERY